MENPTDTLPDTGSAQAWAPEVRLMDVMSAKLLSIDDRADRHAAVIALRNRRQAEAKQLTRWANFLRQELAAAAKSERKAAAELGLSRSGVRKKVPKK